MRFQEGRPCNTPTSGWSGFNQVIAEDSADGAAADLDIEVGQGTLNSGVSPARILGGHSYDELFDIDLGTRPTRMTALRKCPLLGDEFSMPAKQGGGVTIGSRSLKAFRPACLAKLPSVRL